MADGRTDGKPWQFPVWGMGLLGAFLAIGIIVAIEAIRTDGKMIENKSPLGKSQSLVRSYLKDNLNDPDFQELEWGPLREYRIGYLISLRYRSRNAFNAWRMTTDLFYVFDGSVLVIEADHPIAEEYSFPN